MPNPFDPGHYRSEELRSFGFRAVGDNVEISRNCTIIGLGRISIGSNVRIDGYTTIVAASGSVKLGSYVHIAGGCHLSGAGGIVMEDFTGISQGVRLYSTSDDFSGAKLTSPLVPRRFTGARSEPVRLARHVIVGAGSVILPGVDIGEGVAVGALSLVRKSLEPWGVYIGAPAKRVAERSRQMLDLEKQLLSERPVDEA